MNEKNKAQKLPLRVRLWVLCHSMRLKLLNIKEMDKRPRQVRRWLRKQPYWGSFRKFVWMEEDRSLRDKLEVLLGYAGPTTFIDAFDWGSTLQGFNEWKAIHDSFLDWYYNSNNI